MKRTGRAWRWREASTSLFEHCQPSSCPSAREKRDGEQPTSSSLSRTKVNSVHTAPSLVEGALESPCSIQRSRSACIAIANPAELLSSSPSSPSTRDLDPHSNGLKARRIHLGASDKSGEALTLLTSPLTARRLHQSPPHPALLPSAPLRALPTPPPCPCPLRNASAASPSSGQSSTATRVSS